MSIHLKQSINMPSYHISSLRFGVFGCKHHIEIEIDYVLRSRVARANKVVLAQ